MVFSPPAVSNTTGYNVLFTATGKRKTPSFITNAGVLNAPKRAATYGMINPSVIVSIGSATTMSIAVSSVLEIPEEDIDAKIAAMSPDELADAIMSLAGSWSDREDITDNWLDELRADMTAGWEERLKELYGDDLSI